ncbi:MAG: hypothetical protein LBC96_08865 [Lachnospiraceae bacterium]|jgi:hypothetical protein|nr:hypothetical protein [Lachnospiraceae bacterium]
MRRKYLSIILLLFVSLIIACGNNQDENETITNSCPLSGQGEAGIVSDSTINNGATAVNGYAFVDNGIAVVIDADFAPILAALGEPRSYFEAASCAFEGLDKVYTYGGFEIDTYPRGERDFVSAIILRDDTVATAEGVMIGSTRAAMEAAYGTGIVTADGEVIYSKDEMRLVFILTDDKIVSIEYQTMVLDI